MGGKATTSSGISDNGIGKSVGGASNPAAIKFKKQFSRVSTGATNSTSVVKE